MAQQPPQPDEIEASKERAKTSQARIKTTHGDIVFSFFPDDAPVHTAAFMKLADSGFYNGLTFHRVRTRLRRSRRRPDGRRYRRSRLQPQSGVQRTAASTGNRRDGAFVASRLRRLATVRWISFVPA